MRRSRPRPAALSLVAVLATAALPVAASGPAEAQTGEKIMERAADAHEERIEGIRDYTVTQEIEDLGQVVTHRFEKHTRDGRPVFVPADDAEDDAAPRGWGNPYEIFLEMAGRTELLGRETVDGHDVWTLEVEDFSGLETSSMTPAGARGEFRPATATFQVDAQSHVIRRLSMRGDMVGEDAENAIEMTARFDDYREREGMLYPFRTRISVDGMDAVMSPEDRERARRQLRDLRARLDSLPEEERARVEARVRPQLEQLEWAVEGGRVDVTVVVRRLEVNREDGGGA